MLPVPEKSNTYSLFVIDLSPEKITGPYYHYGLRSLKPVLSDFQNRNEINPPYLERDYYELHNAAFLVSLRNVGGLSCPL